MKLQEQHWGDHDAFLFISEHCDASVCVRIVKCEPTHAYIGSLWVAEKDRRKGIGGILLEQAERLAKSKGCKFTAQWYIPRTTPKWTLDWYKRIGYMYFETDLNGDVLLRKEIN